MSDTPLTDPVGRPERLPREGEELTLYAVEHKEAKAKRWPKSNGPLKTHDGAKGDANSWRYMFGHATRLVAYRVTRVGVEEEREGSPDGKGRLDRFIEATMERRNHADPNTVPGLR